MLNALEHNPQVNIEQVLNTPKEDTNIISVCDRLIVSLQAAEKASPGTEYTFLDQSFGALTTISVCAGGVMGFPRTPRQRA